MRGAEGFPARVEDRGRGADDVTVCGGDSSRGPCRPGATWPCPSPRPTARLPRTKRTGLPRPRRETPSHPLLSSEAPTTPSWLLTSEKEAPSAAPRNSSGAASSARPGAVPSRDSWGPAPAPAVTTPFRSGHARRFGPGWGATCLFFSHPWDRSLMSICYKIDTWSLRRKQTQTFRRTMGHRRTLLLNTILIISPVLAVRTEGTAPKGFVHYQNCGRKEV